ncbi:MFS general substrate transporter [Aaosphaeria arxii CBS 175.79]|uniref:MFS general substrate transporter n=1 Tax=Aaosphaeria arxii CBS 175.79 TaxID=1450172 RepID=A0A6A5X949_9PLEO|nr:MFS general substrate transporter [Aaosphaeria arxii CBS 175.79]KAF2009284.1 MFS general substrate transporter [Aaosphaeria arxii CBS 175.79]
MTEAAPDAVETFARETKEELSLPPEGGTKGWLCVSGAFLAIFCTFGFLNAIGVFQTTYEETILHSYTPSEISWIFATQLALMWAPGPIFGRLVDTYGAAPVLYPCSFLCVFSLCMTSLADEYYQIFLAQGLGFGIGAGGVFTTAVVCIGQWHVRRRALATGIATAGSSLGGVIFPIFFHRVMERVGFYGAIRYTALMIGILMAVSCFLITARLPRKKWDWQAKWFDVTLFKQKQFGLFTIGSFLTMWAIFAPLNFLPSMAQQNGFSPSLALYLISIVNASSTFGRTIPPYLADHIGSFNVITSSAALSGIAMLALWLPFNYHSSHTGLIFFALAYGFFSGAFVSLLMPCVAKAGSIETLGRRFGTFQIIMSISNLTGLPIMGAILVRQGGVDFSGLQIFAGVNCILGSVLLLVATYSFGKTQGTWKV